MSKDERSTKTDIGRTTLWGDGYNLYSVSAVYNQSATLLNDYTACTNVAALAECKYGWGSFHSAGINFVMCDGSVRTIPLTINMTIFVGMRTIAYGENIGE